MGLGRAFRLAGNLLKFVLNKARQQYGVTSKGKKSEISLDHLHYSTAKKFVVMDLRDND